MGSHLVRLQYSPFLISIRLPRRENSNDGFTVATVTENENSQFEAYPEQDESVFILRMLAVKELNGLLIEKNDVRFSGSSWLWIVFARLNLQHPHGRPPRQVALPERLQPLVRAHPAARWRQESFCSFPVEKDLPRRRDHSSGRLLPEKAATVQQVISSFRIFRA
jgi:hypothetical protein